MGSENIFHNLGAINRKADAISFDCATKFDDRVARPILEGRHEEFCGYQKLGPSASLSISTPDHYHPLLYALGGGRGLMWSFLVEGGVHWKHFDGGVLFLTGTYN